MSGCYKGEEYMDGIYDTVFEQDKAKASALNQLSSGDSYQMSQGLNLLGKIGTRDVFPMITSYLGTDLAAEAISALASSKDSRAYFPLVNFHNVVRNGVVQRKILQYLLSTKDPRAVDFLEEVIELDGRSDHVSIAEQALKSCRDNHDFLYRFEGTDAELEVSKNREGQVPFYSSALDENEEYLREFQRGRGRGDLSFPHTFIIGRDRILNIGLPEHVQVARGVDVLAAGEINFVKEDGVWRVTDLTYRSSGYWPAESSFYWVDLFFKNNTDIVFDKTKFDGDFPREGYNDLDFLSIFMFGDHGRDRSS